MGRKDSCVLCLTETGRYLKVNKVLDEIEIKIASVLKKHFWLDIKDEAKICKSCWKNTANFHKFYCEIESVHNKEHLEFVAEQIYIKPELSEILDAIDETEPLDDTKFDGLEVLKDLVLPLHGVEETVDEQKNEDVEIKEEMNSVSDDEDTILKKRRKAKVNSYKEDELDDIYDKKISQIELDDDDEEYKPTEIEKTEKTMKPEKPTKRSSTPRTPRKKKEDHYQPPTKKKSKKEESDLDDEEDDDSDEENSDSDEEDGSSKKLKYKASKKVEEKYMESLRCPLCKDKFRDIIKMKKHMTAKHFTKCFTRCPFIPKDTVRNRRKYSDCFTKFHTRQKALEHIRNHFMDDIVISPVDVNDYDTHSYEDTLACDKCDYRFSLQEDLDMHMEEEHKVERWKDDELLSYCGNRLSCEPCGFTDETIFWNFHELEKHFKEVHADINLPFIRCMKCNKKIHRRNPFVDHMKAHENPEDFRCKICDKIVLGREYMQIHMSQHRRDAPVDGMVCDLCGKSFLNKSRLSKHMKNIHSEKNFKCVECNPDLIMTQQQYSMHLKMHHSKMEVICQHCTKRFRFQYELRNHMVYHDPSLIQRQDCPHCGQSYKSKRVLKIHIRKFHVAQDQEVSCKKCNRVFPNRRKLYTHTTCREAKYFCSFCDYKAKNKKRIVEHTAANHTREVLYQCEYCDRQYSFISHLYEHKNKYHPVQWAKQKADNLEKRRTLQI